MASNMAQRVGFALIAIPVLVGLVWYGGWPLALVVAVAGALGAREIGNFARHQGIHPFRPLMTAAAVALPLLAWAQVSSERARDLIGTWWPFAAAGWVLVVMLAALWRRAPTARPLGAIAVTLFAPVYTGGLPAFVLAIRHADYGLRSVEGAAMVFFPLAVVWICDSAAMMVGKRLGGPRLAPTVSPGKTWSGTIGGFAAALLVAPLWHALVFTNLHMVVSPWPLLVVAAAIGVLGQLGDLAESLLKREVGFKDSSHLIPGHGGVLDRLDSLYFALPLSAGLYKLFGLL